MENTVENTIKAVPVRQSDDITAADDEPSEILRFFSGSKVFLTGGTGYLGRLFLEKLLRQCDVEMIYVLVRPKKGKEPQVRFEGPSMELLKQKNPNYLSKVTLISGDCCLPDLGMRQDDIRILQEEINCVIHCAATVRFDEKIKTAVYINVRSLMDLLRMSRAMKNLKAFLYVSTTFSHCTQSRIEETFYPAPISSEKLLAVVEALDDDQLMEWTPMLLRNFPNTYVFTKAVAEDVLHREGQFLPIALMRPSIVIASYHEPVSGWIDNFYGPTGVLIGAALGLIRSANGKLENFAELVPADYVINCGLAIMYETATIKPLNVNQESKHPTSRECSLEKVTRVYNFVSYQKAPITWGEYVKLSEKYGKQKPFPLFVWHYFFRVRRSKLAHTLAIFLLHTIPAHIVDFLAICIQKEPKLVKAYKKINKLVDVVGYFASNQWVFANDNVQNLWKKLNKKDKELFYFSMANFNWNDYFYFYLRGARMYLLKEPLSTVKL